MAKNPFVELYPERQGRPGQPNRKTLEGGVPAIINPNLVTLAQVKADADVADALTKKHSQNTDTGTTSPTFTADSVAVILEGDARLTDDRNPTSHGSTHTNGTDDIQDATSGQKGLATSTQITKLDGIEAGANNTPASISRTFHVNLFHFPDTVSGWEPVIYGAHLAASMVGLKCWIPLNFLKAGDIITSYNLVGDAIETNALTLDCKLVQVNKANPLTTTDITNGAMVQVTADGNFDVAVNPVDTTVTTDHQYLLEILGTTGLLDEIYVIGAEITITRLI
jgi:hypothetical protein